MVGVQDQQHVEGADNLGVDLIGLSREAERHPQEVLDQGQRVVRVQERLAHRLLVGVGGDGRQLGQQPDRGELDLCVVQRVHRVRVVGAQRVHGAGQHRHRVGVAREAVEEPLEVLVQQRVALDLGGELLQFLGGGQFAVDQQITDLDEGGLLGQLLDRVAAVPQDSGVAVDVGDGTLGRRCVDEALVVGRVAGRFQARLGEDADAAARQRGVDDLQVQLATRVLQGGVVVGCGHKNPFCGLRLLLRQSVLGEGSRYSADPLAWVWPGVRQGVHSRANNA